MFKKSNSEWLTLLYISLERANDVLNLQVILIFN